MAAQLANDLQHTSIEDALVFSPDPTTWPDLTLSPPPKYLFRLYTPKSDGNTTEEVASSRDATPPETAGYDQDVFTKPRSSLSTTAESIAQHLRWTKGTRTDNLLSWSSSLLFVLLYIFKRRFDERDGSAFDDIRILIIDTEEFPTHTFIRDLDLISAFQNFETTGYRGKGSLASLEDLRSGKFGPYYFGEYLSQGSLTIRGRCKSVSVQRMIDLGLLDMHPVLHTAASGSDAQQWAEPVLEIRKTIENTCHESPAPPAVLSTAFDIAMEFDGNWRLPVAIHLLSILPNKLDDQVIFNKILERLNPTGTELATCANYFRAVHAPDSMPELQRARAFMKTMSFQQVQASLESSQKLITYIMSHPTSRLDRKKKKLTSELRVALDQVACWK